MHVAGHGRLALAPGAGLDLGLGEEAAHQRLLQGMAGGKDGQGRSRGTELDDEGQTGMEGLLGVLDTPLRAGTQVHTCTPGA